MRVTNRFQEQVMTRHTGIDCLIPFFCTSDDASYGSCDLDRTVDAQSVAVDFTSPPFLVVILLANLPLFTCPLLLGTGP